MAWYSSGAVEQLYTIQTPQNVEFAFRIAGLPSRALAWLVDAAIMAVLLLICALVAMPFLAAGIAGLFPEGFVLAFLYLVSFVVLFGYCLFFELRWAGQTPGKRLLHLRVIRDDGTTLDLRASLIRNLLRLVDGFPPALVLPQSMLVGALVALPGRTTRRLGDWAAGTLVVQVPRTRVPAGFQATRGAYNSFRDDPALVARIRRSINLQERELLIDLCVRRDEVELEHRVALFEAASDYLCERLGLERQEHMSHEKVVQNVTDLLLDDAPQSPAPPA
jgi:uncharacterized RDD family membrane protein YckC